MRRIAIVGSVAFKDPGPERCVAKRFLCELLEGLDPNEVMVVSGGAEGIDSLAAEEARTHGFEVKEFLPENPRWAPRGYKERNQRIADFCTELISIRHHASTTYGSGWTSDRAEEQGKLVERLKVTAEGRLIRG